MLFFIYNLFYILNLQMTFRDQSNIVYIILMSFTKCIYFGKTWSLQIKFVLIGIGYINRLKQTRDKNALSLICNILFSKIKHHLPNFYIISFTDPTITSFYYEENLFVVSTPSLWYFNPTWEYINVFCFFNMFFLPYSVSK